jgi:hypothetical protein
MRRFNCAVVMYRRPMMAAAIGRHDMLERSILLLFVCVVLVLLTLPYKFDVLVSD